MKYSTLTLSLICSANQWTGFYMITALIMKELKMWLNSSIALDWNSMPVQKTSTLIPCLYLLIAYFQGSFVPYTSVT